MNRSCRNAFICSLLIAVVVMPAGALTENAGVSIVVFTVNFAAIILVFTILLQIYDKQVKD